MNILFVINSTGKQLALFLIFKSNCRTLKKEHVIFENEFPFLSLSGLCLHTHIFHTPSVQLFH